MELAQQIEEEVKMETYLSNDVIPKIYSTITEIQVSLDPAVLTRAKVC